MPNLAEWPGAGNRGKGQIAEHITIRRDAAQRAQEQRNTLAKGRCQYGSSENERDQDLRPASNPIFMGKFFACL